MFYLDPIIMSHEHDLSVIMVTKYAFADFH